jgi:hypothetical protein
VELAPFVSPEGQPIFTAGGRNAWATHEHRGFVVSLEWTRRRRRTVPTMVIWPAHNLVRVGSQSNGMWVVTRDALIHFIGFNANDKCTGSVTGHLISEAREALALMGKDRNDKQAHSALIDCVIRYAEELNQMPPAPLTVRHELASGGVARGPLWQVTATHKSTGRVIHEGEA